MLRLAGVLMIASMIPVGAETGDRAHGHKAHRDHSPKTHMHSHHDRHRHSMHRTPRSDGTNPGTSTPQNWNAFGSMWGGGSIDLSIEPTPRPAMKSRACLNGNCL